MKNKFLSIVMGSFFVTALSVSAASAFQIDTLLGTADLGSSGDAEELALIQTLTGDSNLTLDFKTNSFTALSNGPDSWYLDVAPNEPGYFLLKFGTGNTGLDSHYVFENIGELDKLVWSVNDVPLSGMSCQGCGIGKLSHFAYSGDGDVPPAQTPEPGTIFLMGSGLAGLGFWRWKKDAKNQA